MLDLSLVDLKAPRPDIGWDNVDLDTGRPAYAEFLNFRQRQILLIRHDPRLLIGLKEYYRNKPVQWIEDWVTTYDPRDAMTGVSKVPFILFQKQREFVEFLHLLVTEQQSGLVEKSRELGVTWICCAFAIWLWIYYPGAAIGFGSRKQELVDELGMPDSIFEKLRMVIRGLPREMLPYGFADKRDLTFMRIINPENGATISGEVGDNIGRGGRKLIYFKDESAHYEHPEMIEASLSENTRVQVDVSSVSGYGTVFERKREYGVDWNPGQKIVKGKTNVFVMDWRDDPRKSQSWYDEKRTKFEEEGLLHIFKQEIDRDYSASMEGIIIPGEWVKASIDAHKVLGFDASGAWGAGLDVADEGGDTNALVGRKGPVVQLAQQWGERDTGATTRRAVDVMRRYGPLDIQYDAVGVGAGVKSEYNRLVADKLIPRGMGFVGWFAGAKVLHPDRHVVEGDRTSPLNKDFYENFKAQAWWALRRRFELTWRTINDPLFEYNQDDLISLPSTLPLIKWLEKELSQPCMVQSTKLKLKIDKKPEGAKSPNIADALVMAFFPARGSLPSITNTMLVRSLFPKTRKAINSIEPIARKSLSISIAALKRSRSK